MNFARGCLLLFLPLLLLPACVSKGDTVVSDDTTREGGSLCAQYCDKIEEDCGLTVPNCEADCLDEAVDCEAASDVFYECFLANPLRCGSSLTSTSAATCDDESVAVEECKSLRDGNCNGESCGEDSVCVGVGDDQASYHCALLCNDNTQCQLGCCDPLGDGDSVCSDPSFCAPVPLGNPCEEDADCSEDTVCDSTNFFCTKLCQEDTDCDTTYLGFAMRCVNFDEEDPDNGLCTPTCNEEADCASYVLINGCIEGDGYNYCL